MHASITTSDAGCDIRCDKFLGLSKVKVYAIKIYFIGRCKPGKIVFEYWPHINKVGVHQWTIKNSTIALDLGENHFQKPTMQGRLTTLCV